MTAGKVWIEHGLALAFRLGVKGPLFLLATRLIDLAAPRHEESGRPQRFISRLLSSLVKGQGKGFLGRKEKMNTIYQNSRQSRSRCTHMTFCRFASLPATF